LCRIEKQTNKQTKSWERWEEALMILLFVNVNERRRSTQSVYFSIC
jgi:hypothetical protein